MFLVLCWSVIYVNGTLRDFSVLRMCSLLNVIDISEFLSIAVTTCLNVWYLQGARFHLLVDQ